MLYVKGAAEQVLAMCDRALGTDGGSVSLEPGLVLASAEELGRRGQRVLAFAEGRLDEHGIDLERPKGTDVPGRAGAS